MRDPRMWARYVADAMERFGDATEVLIGQHHWPVWGGDNVRAYLARQRDLYKHVHDQLTHVLGKTAADADASITTTRATLDAIALGRTTILEALAAGSVSIEGDGDAMRTFIGMLDNFTLMFDVVTPGDRPR